MRVVLDKAIAAKAREGLLLFTPLSQEIVKKEVLIEGFNYGTTSPFGKIPTSKQKECKQIVHMLCKNCIFEIGELCVKELVNDKSKGNPFKYKLENEDYRDSLLLSFKFDGGSLVRYGENDSLTYIDIRLSSSVLAPDNKYYTFIPRIAAKFDGTELIFTLSSLNLMEEDTSNVIITPIYG